MTPEDRTHLMDLFHAAFEQARSADMSPPIDLMHFGKFLRQVEHDFSHQTYGYEKLLHLLRDFKDFFYIKRDAEVVPPRYYVGIRRSSPRPATRQNQEMDGLQPLNLLEPQLVDCSVLDHYLIRLAETTALIHARLDEHERRFPVIQDQFEQSRANEARLHTQTQEHQHQLSSIQDELKQSRANETRLHTQEQEHARRLENIQRELARAQASSWTKR